MPLGLIGYRDLLRMERSNLSCKESEMPRENFLVKIPAPWVMTQNGAEIDSGVVPDALFASQSAAGVTRRKPTDKWIPPTPYSLLFTRWTRGSGLLDMLYKSTQGGDDTLYRYSGCVTGLPHHNVTNTFDECMLPTGGYDFLYHASECYRKALNKASQKHVDLGVAWAERKKTANLIGNYATMCGQSILALKRGRFRQAANILGVRPGRDYGPKLWARKWLEWKYGWMPMVNDVEGAVKVLSEMHRSDYRMTVKKTHKKQLKRQSFHGSGWTAAVCETSGWAGVHVRLDMLPSEDAYSGLLRSGAPNLPNILWELIPYSFVLDWFVPVGQWLDSMTAVAMDAGGTSCTSHFCKQSWSASGMPDSYSIPGYDVVHTNNWQSDKKYVQLYRSVGGITMPEFPLPRFDLSLARMASGLSLLTVAFAKPPDLGRRGGSKGR